MQFFSDILSKFSMSQRLIVLLILACTTAVTLILPKYWEISDCSAFEARIASLERGQESLIRTNDLLQNKNYELNVAILKLDSLFSHTVKRQRVVTNQIKNLSTDTIFTVVTPQRVITSECEKKFHNIVEAAVNK